jgi:hypothetical protein
MRDLGLARRQLFGGICLILAGAAIIQWMLIPQYQQFQELRHQTTRFPDVDTSAVLTALPSYSPQHPESWNQQVVQPLQQLARRTHVKISPILGEPEQGEGMKGLPPVIRHTDLVLAGQGRYSNWKAFMQALPTHLPYTCIQSIDLQQAPVLSVPGKPSAGTGVKAPLAVTDKWLGVLHLDVVFREPSNR